MKTIAKTQDKPGTLLSKARESLSEVQNFLSEDGKKYELHDWVTIAEYCRRFNIPNIQTVSNCVKRGIIPEQNTVVIEEYNHIRLIKAMPYNEKSSPANETA